MEAQAYQHWTVTYEKNDLVPDAIVRCAFYASTLLSITVEMNNAIKGMGASRKRGEYAGSMLFELWVDRRPDVLVYPRSVLGGEGRSREPEMATEKIVLGQGQDSIEKERETEDVGVE